MAQICTTAPAKAILFGEHAVNRGQTALAISVGLPARCTLTTTSNDYYRFISGSVEQQTSHQDVIAFGNAIDGWLAQRSYEPIQQLARSDLFAPFKYVLAAVGSKLPTGLTLDISSTIPQSVGLGSGGAAFVACAAALATLIGYPETDATRSQIGQWAQRGDSVAHGGVASGLDTHTSLYGGVIRYSSAQGAQRLTIAPGMALVIGNTHVIAETSLVNGRVRRWLADRPSRMHYFHEIGLLSQLAESALATGDWLVLGHLMNLNQLLLERIGVSCPELETLNEAALEAGAFGAKLTGSGGGGVMIALSTPEQTATIAEALRAAGGTSFVVPIGVPGVQLLTQPERATHA